MLAVRHVELSFGDAPGKSTTTLPRLPASPAFDLSARSTVLTSMNSLGYRVIDYKTGDAGGASLHPITKNMNAGSICRCRCIDTCTSIEIEVEPCGLCYVHFRHRSTIRNSTSLIGPTMCWRRPTRRPVQSPVRCWPVCPIPILISARRDAQPAFSAGIIETELRGGRRMTTRSVIIASAGSGKTSTLPTG